MERNDHKGMEMNKMYLSKRKNRKERNGVELKEWKVSHFTY